MERCVFVSANGGWNLLIGTFPEGEGAWVALDGERVPAPCREVFQEASKDDCFGKAAKNHIRGNFAAWVTLIPAKWRATFDYTAAAANHLEEAGALSGAPARFLKIAELAFQRIMFLAALSGAAWIAYRKGQWSVLDRRLGPLIVGGLVLGGVLGFGGFGAAWGWLCVCALSFLSVKPWRDPGIGVAVFGVTQTIIVHAVFFGAGRYSLPLLFWTAPLSAAGCAAVMEVIAKKREQGPSLPGSGKILTP
jgi:hypothetical protein